MLLVCAHWFLRGVGPAMLCLGCIRVLHWKAYKRTSRLFSEHIWEAESFAVIVVWDLMDDLTPEVCTICILLPATQLLDGL